MGKVINNTKAAYRSFINCELGRKEGVKNTFFPQRKHPIKDVYLDC